MAKKMPKEDLLMIPEDKNQTNQTNNSALAKAKQSVNKTVAAQVNKTKSVNQTVAAQVNKSQSSNLTVATQVNKT
jgi:hypothetical protein